MPNPSETSCCSRVNRRSSGARGIAVCALGLLLAHRASADVVRLEELEAKSVANRGAVVAAAQRAASARAEGDVARSAYAPTAALNVEASESPGGRLVHVMDVNGADYLVSGSRTLDEPGAFVPLTRYGALLSLQARLYDFGRTSTAVAAADARAAAARAAESATRDSIIREVSAAYLDWLEAIVLHAASERVLANARARQQVVEGRIATGVRPRSDLEPVLYDVAVAELDETAASGKTLDARLDLERAAATPLANDSVPDPALLDREVPVRNTATPPSTVLLERRRSAALAMARFREHETRPVLTAAAEAGLRGQDTELFPAYRAGVSLSAPLWDGGASNARAAAARAEAAALDAELREERASVASERDRAWNDYTNAAKRLQIAERLLDIASARARDADARYDIGNEKIEIVLEAGAAVSRAEREVLVAKVSRAAAVLRLGGPNPSHDAGSR